MPVAEVAKNNKRFEGAVPCEEENDQKTETATSPATPPTSKIVKAEIMTKGSCAFCSVTPKDFEQLERHMKVCKKNDNDNPSPFFWRKVILIAFSQKGSVKF